MTDLTLFREYEPQECYPDDYRDRGKRGYPFVWLDVTRRGWTLEEVEGTVGGSGVGVKELVREEAGGRCVRCGHPYTVGGHRMEHEKILMEAGWREGQDGLWRTDEFGGSFGPELAVEQAAERGKAMLWSPCDEHCTHGGPLRTWIGTWIQTTDMEIAAQQERSSGLPVEAAWRILTVHHLNERKHDLRWWNLVSLCQRCHLEIQRKVTMTDPWPWEHTEWFRPYAAAWYAYRYLGETLTREETEARLPELLAGGMAEESVERMPI